MVLERCLAIVELVIVVCRRGMMLAVVSKRVCSNWELAAAFLHILVHEVVLEKVLENCSFVVVAGETVAVGVEVPELVDFAVGHPRSQTSTWMWEMAEDSGRRVVEEVLHLLSASLCLYLDNPIRASRVAGP